MNGGYVRDLLLGKAPDDLDLSLCLRDCPPDITLVRVMALMEPFARSRPDLNVSSVKVSVARVDVPPPCAPPCRSRARGTPLPASCVSK